MVDADTGSGRRAGQASSTQDRATVDCHQTKLSQRTVRAKDNFDLVSR
jgi:hypothetical protein